MDNRHSKKLESKQSDREAVAGTAKTTLQYKYLSAAPSFWQKTGRGNRKTALFHNECADNLLSSKEKAPRASSEFIFLAVRERWINKVFHHYIKNKGCQQVVILGSGFDIRPLKKSKHFQKDKKNAAIYAQVKFWEIDQESVLTEKERIFKENNLDKNATYLKADYTKDDFCEMLSNAGFDSKLSTLVIWEGNLTYLNEQEITDVIAKLQALIADFVIVFDYHTQDFISGVEISVFKSGIDDISKFAEKHNLKMIDNRNVGELEKEYDVDDKPTDQASAYYVCSATKKR